jgi:hypothetical protein
VTQLRQKMLEELRRRNYSDRTAHSYVRIVATFARHFGRSPDELGLTSFAAIKHICCRSESWR